MKTPNIIEPLDYELILQAMKDQLARNYPGISMLESEPAIKILEIAAWRELNLRARINEAARANLLHFATDADLDHLAVFYGLVRKESESDEMFKNRISAKIAGFATSGSKEHYRYFALSADSSIKDAKATSPMPGLVQIAILSDEMSNELLEKIEEYLNRDDIKMLTDTIQVIAYETLPVTIEADVYLYPQTPNILDLAKSQLMKKFVKTRSLGWDLTRSWIIANLFTDGIQKIDLTSPLEDIIVKDHQSVDIAAINLKMAGTNW